MLEVKKRLILKQDINFDIAGTDEVVTFKSADGTNCEGKKINAGDLPLKQGTRLLLSATNVDEALKILAEKKSEDDPGQGVVDGLTGDVKIEFTTADGYESIIATIESQKRSLNGYTLTFAFPKLYDQKLFGSFVWKGFYGGKIIIQGGDNNNNINLLDMTDVGALFTFESCDCEIEIEYFNFVHSKSPYGLSVKNTRALVVSNCAFSGSGYAVKPVASSVTLENCALGNDKAFDDHTEKELAKLEEKKLSLDGGTMTGNITLGNNAVIDSISGVEIIGGKDKATASSMAFTDGDFELGCVDEDGNRKALCGSFDGGLLYDEKDITLGYPDYKSGVALGAVKEYTAAFDGWLYVYCHINGKQWNISIDGVIVFRAGGTEHHHNSCFLPVKKDSVITLDGSVVSSEMVFYPNK